MIKRLGYVGSRGFKDLSFIRNHVREQVKLHGKENIEIISGGAKGPDKAAVWEATLQGVKFKVFVPKWTELGKKAGFVRNLEIIGYVANQGEIFAFWDGTSHGTKHTIESSINAGLKITVFKEDGSVQVFNDGEQQEIPF